MNQPSRFLNALQPKPQWGLLKTAEFLERKPGFAPATGYHIYCELRPVAAFEAADDGDAEDYVAVIEDYVRMGEEAARSYGLVLLELQGRVLHFFREGAETPENTNDVLDFSHEFTQSAYSQLRTDMKERWHGFATAFDHGDCILINERTQHTTSTVSLGPSANRPAKRLFSPSPAGHVSAPTRLVRHIQDSKEEWVDINLRNRIQSPSKAHRLMEKFAALQHLPRNDAARITNFTARQGENILHWTPENPLRVIGSAVRCDLDGFTKIIQNAFAAGDHQVAQVARSFKELMEYAEIVASAHQPCIMLPWAGDCITFLLPDTNELNVRIPRWLDFCMDWLASEVNGSASPLTRSITMKPVKWGIGAARGYAGNLVVASTRVQANRFMIAAGWPSSTAKSAQESAKGGEVAIQVEDHQQLNGAAKALFEQKNGDNFWVSSQVSREELKRRASTIGAVSNSPIIAPESDAKISPPPQNRPYYQTNV